MLIRGLAAGLVLFAAGIIAIGVLAAATPPPAITTPLSVQWTFSMSPDPADVAPPVVQGDRVFVSHGGTLYCLDNMTGAEVWKFSPEHAGISTAPVPWKDTIIVGATNATVYGLEAATGKPVWERICASTIAASPLVVNDELIVGAGQMVYSLSPDTGDASWICSLDSPAKSGPVSDGSMGYFLCHDGSVQCVDISQGRYRWSVDLRTGPRTFRPVTASQRVIVASGNYVYGVARSGSLAWTAEMPTAVGAGPALIGDLLYVPCVDGKLYTLYPRSGAPYHHIDYSIDHSITSTPVVTDNIVAVGTGDALVYLFDAATGKVKWTYRCRAPEQLASEGAEYGIYAPLVISNGSVYCLVGSGDLYRFSASAPDPVGPSYAEFYPDPGSAIPGNQYVGPALSITDDGSGVDPTSITATVDGKPIPVTFEPVDGLALLDASALPDGSHIVKVTAKDNRGHETSTEWSFLTDSTIQPSPEQIAAMQQRGMRGGGMRGGGGGGMRGGGGGGGMRGGGGGGGGGGGMRGGGGGRRGR